ncbi:MAG TPA: ATP-binding protein [Anaerolineae bacterium]
MSQSRTGLRWRGLTPQLFIFVVLPLVILLIAIPFGSMALHQRGMRLLVAERDERAARTAAAAITEQLYHRAAALQGLALHSSVSDSPGYTITEYGFLLPDFEDGLVLFAADGTLLASSNSPDIWQARPVADLLDRAKRRNEPQFSAAFTGSTGGEPMMLVAAASNGTLAVGAFRPASLARRALADAFTSNGPASVWLTDSAGQPLYQSGAFPAESELANHAGVAEALRGETGVTYRRIDGSEHVVAYSPITPVGWALVIEEPWDAVDSPLLRTSLVAPLALIPPLLIAVVVIAFGVRRIVRPLQQLDQHASRAGWGDYAALAQPVDGIAEIQQLHATLAHMADQIRRYQRSIQSYAAALTRGQEDERARLAHELHDETVQALIALDQRVQMIERLYARDPQAAAQKLPELRTMTAKTIEDVRRITRALRPIYLEDLGLLPALEALTKTVGAEGDLVATFEVEGQARRLPIERELALYRIVQEALNNVVRHAHAKQVQVKVIYAGALVVSVTDDGVGFDLPDRADALTDLGHFGLVGMRERAELIGAHLTIQSARGNGTTIELRLPL